MQKGSRIEIHIDRLSMGGRGVGRHDGMVVFVADTAPNELVVAEITFVKKNFAQAKLIEVLKASPFRQTPPCPVAGVCGGCSWQHVTYDEQLNQKHELVSDAFRKFAKGVEVSVEPVVASPLTFNYRNRIQLHFDRGQLGFFKRESHDVVDIKECLIAERELNEALQKTREVLNAGDRTAARVELMRTTEGRVLQSEDARYDDELGFAQVNEQQNQQLIAYVLEQAKPNPPTRVFDFYAGSGNFTFPLAKLFPEAKFTAVELHKKSVEIGNRRAGAEGLAARVEFIAKPVEEFLQSTASLHQALVILDPPRAGCAPGVMDQLKTLAPTTMIYISCHPVTLARDISLLSDTYKVESLQPFDMFPQTDHVEAVAYLKRKP